ncbi:FxsB family cyclophane-forming radical SAM/SPASM peptide maturase [Streptomyces luteolus]|uniref:FxsB family radical SAM/SPASM domain protein n=1 Tax=Streptomyces luteolus TaxID=3043615 RepID=A0ABT6SR65_9ACTN|nr:FxsB family cyclophane-forming radical SAM/SPASM peptide maturase [Streptomyces sp. B-S-A12]MDI3417132.1 FxsB family radical SAM/SPASM domain protein [Streptomyces sp. B-S-A12]
MTRPYRHAGAAREGLQDGRAGARDGRAGARDDPAGARDGFRQFVLKVHSRCNLACTYCYIYTGPDGSWRERPRRVPDTTVRQVAHGIAEHTARHRLARIRIDLHGGEPLLSGAGFLISYADTVRSAVRKAAPATRVDVTVQTNGTLLTEAALDRLAAAGIRVGLSLDGGTAALNARRVDHAGRSSWRAVRRAAELLASRPEAYAGMLSTIDLATDPREVYRSLRRLGPPSLDFLLPHANWAGRAPGRHRPSPTPYADWLVPAFELWWADREEGRPRLRLFSEILAMLLGAESATEAVGLSPLAVVVIDTDGTIEQVDALKSAYDGAPATGLDVFRNSFDEALRHPGIAARRQGLRALADECLACPVVRVCGGGNYAHRYAARTGGFRHPSVYCADLERLIRHLADRLATELDHGPQEAFLANRGTDCCN